MIPDMFDQGVPFIYRIRLQGPDGNTSTWMPQGGRYVADRVKDEWVQTDEPAPAEWVVWSTIVKYLNVLALDEQRADDAAVASVLKKTFATCYDLTERSKTGAFFELAVIAMENIREITQAIQQNPRARFSVLREPLSDREKAHWERTEKWDWKRDEEKTCRRIEREEKIRKQRSVNKRTKRGGHWFD